MSSPGRVVYMGTPHYARMILQHLLDAEDMQVTLVVTQPDRPVGRKRVLTPPPVKELAAGHGIEVLQPLRLTEEGIAERIAEEKPDFIVVAAFGQILPRSILDIAPCINLHASLLPRYRGASPVQQSLLNGDRYSGVSAMLMEEGLDSGPVLGFSCFRIPDEMRLGGLMEELSEEACILTLDTLRHFEMLDPQPQIRALASYCKKIRRSDGEISFDDAGAIYDKYRAFEGWPGIFTSGGLKLIGMKVVERDEPHRKAVILSIEKSGVVIGCERGSIKLESVQPPSKKPMDAVSYLRGRGLQLGDTLV